MQQRGGVHRSNERQDRMVSPHEKARLGSRGVERRRQPTRRERDATGDDDAREDEGGGAAARNVSPISRPLAAYRSVPSRPPRPPSARPRDRTRSAPGIVQERAVGDGLCLRDVAIQIRIGGPVEIAGRANALRQQDGADEEQRDVYRYPERGCSFRVVRSRRPLRVLCGLCIEKPLA
jgi:hypothetical protein